MKTTTKRVGFELGSRAQKFRVITNRLAGQLIAAKAVAIILKRTIMFVAYLVNNGPQYRFKMYPVFRTTQSNLKLTGYHHLDSDYSDLVTFHRTLIKMFAKHESDPKPKTNPMADLAI